jgi:TolB-like protein/predicted Ser/Thr protein kinase
VAIKCPKCNADNPDTVKFCGDCGTKITSPKEICVTKTIKTPTTGLQKGSTIAGKYRIIEELGRGGMGVVYKAEDTKLKRTVALKFLPPELTHIPDVKERFMREAQAAAALDHPNICTVYEFDEAEEKTFISMAYVEGQSLRKKLESGPLELDEALRIALQVAEGLKIAHKKGVVHRDIKSANIMVTEDNQAKIMDFGLARMAGGTLITQEGTAMGTIAYMSPEQAQGEEVDHRTDIWSFGVVLYEMFTGQLPFKGEHDQAVVYSILNKKPKPLAELRSEIPVSIGQVVDKVLEKNPDKRYQQIDELLDDLKSISAGIVPEEIKARLRKEKLRKRKRAILYAGTVGLVIVIAVLALTLFTGRAEAIDSIAVLPLENLTGDTEKELFVDVATEELIDKLGQISGLRRVISRTTVMKYKKTDKTLSEIARELNVDVIVEGSVQEAGDRVRIQVRLMDALPEEQNLWGQAYERAMSDVRVMYGEIARTIADKAQIDLTADELTRLTSASQVNPESYNAYLKGKSYLDRREPTPEGRKIAQQYFEFALEIDPNNALAYVGIADAWGLAQEALMKAAIDKALEIDNTLAEAHESLGFYRCWIEWDWEGSEKEYQEALRLNPHLIGAHYGYGYLLCIIGRRDEGLPYIERALELDPLNPYSYHFYGLALNYHGRTDDAIAAFRTALEIDPNFGASLGYLALTLAEKGMYEENLAIVRKIYADDAELITAGEDGYEENGFKGAARASADLMAEWYGKPDKNVSAWEIANIYHVAGEYELAIDWYEKCYEIHAISLPAISGIRDPLRSYPRFQDLLRKMNLPLELKEKEGR